MGGGNGGDGHDPQGCGTTRENHWKRKREPVPNQRGLLGKGSLGLVSVSEMGMRQDKKAKQEAGNEQGGL